MKIVEKRKIDSTTAVKYMIYGLAFVFSIGSIYLLWNILKPIPELEVAKIENPKNIPEIKKKNYIFLSTNSGDYINNNLSEERYATLVNLIKQNKGNVIWNIFFSGAEFENLEKTNSENHILSDIKKQAASGITEVGYSAKNESKYQSDLKYYIIDSENKMSFKEKVEKTYEFLNCGKELETGKCRYFAKNEGGAAVIKTFFGDFYNISDIKINSPFSFDFVTYAAKKINKNSGVTLNFSEDEVKNKESAKKLIEILSPTNETPSTLFWMNNRIVINNFDIKNDIKEIKTVDENLNIKNVLADIENKNERSVTVVDFGNSSIYSKVDPIKYAYENGGSAKILTENRNRLTVKENLSNINIQNFEKLVKIVKEKENFSFTSSSKIYTNVVSRDYNNITKVELDRIARWIILKWKENGRIPNWTYDGKNYYSLRDSFYLLYKSFSKRKKIDEYSLPMGVIKLEDVYGPYNMEFDNVKNKTLSREVVMGTIIDYLRINDNGYWEETGEATNAVEGTYKRAREKFSAAEMLYAMAVLYTTDFNGMRIKEINIPKSETYPETYELLRDGFGCNWKEECVATSWSLKPLKLR